MTTKHTLSIREVVSRYQPIVDGQPVLPMLWFRTYDGALLAGREYIVRLAQKAQQAAEAEMRG